MVYAEVWLIVTCFIFWSVFILKAQDVVWQYEKSGFTLDNRYPKRCDDVTWSSVMFCHFTFMKKIGGLILNQVTLCENNYCLSSDYQNNTSIKFALCCAWQTVLVCSPLAGCVTDSGVEIRHFLGVLWWLALRTLQLNKGRKGKTEVCWKSECDMASDTS